MLFLPPQGMKSIRSPGPLIPDTTRGGQIITWKHFVSFLLQLHLQALEVPGQQTAVTGTGPVLPGHLARAALWLPGVLSDGVAYSHRGKTGGLCLTYQNWVGACVRSASPLESAKCHAEGFTCIKYEK